MLFIVLPLVAAIYCFTSETVSPVRPVFTYPEMNWNTSYFLTEADMKKELCPEIEDMGPMRDSLLYDVATDKCHEIGTKGPCPNNLIFHAEANNTIYGQCDCPSFNSSRTLIYHPETERCYPIFQKAYCTIGKWLTLNRTTGNPMCEPNPCFNRKDKQSEELVFVNSKCVKLDSRCDEGKVITFTSGKILPHCTFSHEFVMYSIGAPTQSTCAPGSIKSISGSCQKTWSW